VGDFYFLRGGSNWLHRILFFLDVNILICVCSYLLMTNFEVLYVQVVKFFFNIYI
jgi:hypothetical protein